MVRALAVPDELAEVIERKVRSRTYGQVHELRVLRMGPTIVLRGLVSTYYLKQLAQHAALEVLGGGELRNEITVASRPSLTAPWRSL